MVAESRRVATAPPLSFVGEDAAEFVHVFERHAGAAHDAGPDRSGKARKGKASYYGRKF
ncbi:hypothetical protein [Paraburkholderia elongata]|uniref:hypothetical protein n=1 Tax=Paraburkholderia elongata TaxID=2675747 RepID=UPI001C131680|nr:hypothetical protein [Paraburkholderia elongata]